MSMKTSIVVGEAPETDSEDESNTPFRTVHQVSVKMTTNKHGEVVTGEDSESDSETKEDLKKTEDKKEIDPIKQETILSKKQKIIYDSLLHKKLRENNMTAYRNLHGFFTTQVSEASATLNSTEQQLVKSQLNLQATLNSLRILNTNSLLIRNKLRDILVDAHFLDGLKK